MTRYSNLQRIFSLTFAFSIAAISQSAFAASRTWNNTGTDFNTSGDWNGGVPGTGDVALFNAAEATQPNLSAALTIQEIEFLGASTSGYDLTSSSGNTVALTLTNAGTGSTSAIQTTNTAGTNTIDAALILGAAAGLTQTFTQSSGGTLILNGVISGGNSTSTLSLNSTSTTGLIKLSGANTFTSNIQLIGSGSTVSVADVGNSGATSNLGAGTTITFTGAGSILQYTGAGESASKVISLNNTTGATIDTSAATGALVLTGNLTAPASGAKTLTLKGGSTNSEFQGNIVDGAGGGTTAVNVSAGTWYLSGANTFSGGVSFSTAGVILGVQSASALGTGTFSPGAGSFDNVSGGALTLTTNNAMNLSAATSTFIGTSSLNMGTGAVTLARNAGVTLAVDGSTLTLGGPIGESAAGTPLTVQGGGTLILNGNISSTGLITVNGATLTLAGNNSAASGGVQDKTSSSVLNINTATALGSGTFTITAGTIDNTSGSAQTLTTNNPIVLGGSFTFAGSNNLNLGNGTVAAFTSARTITVNSHTLTIGGNMSGTGGTITKAGAGVLVLGGTETYTGGTSIKAGALIVSGSLSGSTTVGDSANLTTSAVLAGSGTVGALTLGAAASNTGAVANPSDGVAEATGAGTTLHTAAFTIAAGSGATVALQIGRTSPGTSFSADSSDRISTTGNVSLGGNLQLTLQTGYTPTVGDILYLIVDGGTTTTGQFATVNGSAVSSGQFSFDGYNWEITNSASSSTSSFTGGEDEAIEALGAIPEPGTWAMVAGGFGVLICFQRNRRRMTK